MTTRIGTDGPGTGVSASPSAARVTAPPARPFSAAMNAGANAILSGAEQAVTRLPGGPILAAALRPAASGVTVSPVGVGGTAAPASLAPEGTAGTAGTGAVGAPGVAAGSADGGGGIEAALSQSANQNLYFMEIQERISAESRSYSTISNVLKARHDTVKNAIGNIR